MGTERRSWLDRLLGRKKPPQPTRGGWNLPSGEGTARPKGQAAEAEPTLVVPPGDRYPHALTPPLSPSLVPIASWPCGKVVADIYEVVRELGRGGMGVVYLLKERGMERPAAAKRPLGEFVADREQRVRFTREAQVWTELAAHPNIVRAYDVQEVDYLPCIFMEYVDGGSVADLLRSSPSGLPFEEAFRIAIQVCWAMAFAHQRKEDREGHVHRDLKPANLLRTRDGIVKVTDFGLVRPVGLDEEAVKQDLAKAGLSFDTDLAVSITHGAAVGTYPYMAPEQWEGQASPAVDLYAFGVTLCELFCGQRPLDLRTHPKYRDYDQFCRVNFQTAQEGSEKG